MDKLIEQSLRALLAREGVEPKEATWSSSPRSSSFTWLISRRSIRSISVRRVGAGISTRNGR